MDKDAVFMWFLPAFQRKGVFYHPPRHGHAARTMAKPLRMAGLVVWLLFYGVVFESLRELFAQLVVGHIVVGLCEVEGQTSVFGHDVVHDAGHIEVADKRTHSVDAEVLACEEYRRSLGSPHSAMLHGQISRKL